MNSATKALLASVLMLSACATLEPRQTLPATIAVEWNGAVLEIAENEDGFMTLKGLRTTTMMHLAMHDALARINNKYATYAYDGDGQNAEPLAAATQAAFVIARSQYPDKKDELTAINNRWLQKINDGAAKSAGMRLGEHAADAVLAKRRGDGWDSEAEYQWHPMAPGVYAEFSEHSGTPQGFVFGAGWAKARGFALQSPDQFRSPPPPEIDSDEYVRAFAEVKDMGRFESTSRSADQTHLAMWWKDFVENSHNRLARDLITREQLELQEANRLFALLNMSVFDAYVSSFDNKFFYNHWRPYTAIRWAANDGNPDTQADVDWINTHQHTYAFPSYPSAHGTACAAAMSVFTAVFGDDYAFRMLTPQVDVAGPFSGKLDMTPTHRDFDSFSGAAMECALSRVYLGIHFRYDSTAGFDLGQTVGNQVIDKLLPDR